MGWGDPTVTRHSVSSFILGVVMMWLLGRPGPSYNDESNDDLQIKVKMDGSLNDAVNQEHLECTAALEKTKGELKWANSGPVCVIENQLFALRHPIKQTVYDYGGKREYEIPGYIGAPPSTTWKDVLIVAWYTCEGNIYHMLHETLGPINHMIDSHDLENVNVAIVSERPQITNACHNINYRPLFRALDVSVLYYVNDTPTYFKNPNNITDPICFKRAIQVIPDTTGNLHQKLLQWAPPSECEKNKTRIVIVQRKSNRIIRNVNHLQAVALRYIRDVRVVVLEDMPLEDQIHTLTCGNPIVAGVHGAGLAWAQLLKSTGRLSVLIEWSWSGWDAYYAPRCKSDTVMTIESKIPPQHLYSLAIKRNDSGDTIPEKYFDINVSEESWHRDITKAIKHIRFYD